jgi:O-glycosyl hydrolase
MDLSLNGKHFSSPRLHVQEGVVGSVETTSKDKTGYLVSNYIDVKATEILVSNKKRIKMNFTVGILDKTGQKVVTSKSNIIARENENVKITLSENEDSSKHLVLSVVAKRKSL